MLISCYALSSRNVLNKYTLVQKCYILALTFTWVMAYCNCQDLMSSPQTDQEDNSHNLGKCPNTVQSRRLRRFRRRGLWDDIEEAESRRDNKVKFTPRQASVATLPHVQDLAA
jgi:hypothetical protein